MLCKTPKLQNATSVMLSAKVVDTSLARTVRAVLIFKVVDKAANNIISNGQVVEQGVQITISRNI